jgi:citrate lyase gamma subunit
MQETGEHAELGVGCVGGAHHLNVAGEKHLVPPVRHFRGIGTHCHRGALVVEVHQARQLQVGALVVRVVHHALCRQGVAARAVRVHLHRREALDVKVRVVARAAVGHACRRLDFAIEPERQRSEQCQQDQRGPRYQFVFHRK